MATPRGPAYLTLIFVQRIKKGRITSRMPKTIIFSAKRVKEAENVAQALKRGAFETSRGYFSTECPITTMLWR
jgi:hypothetical protein